jgi:hypothetical protein
MKEIKDRLHHQMNKTYDSIGSMLAIMRGTDSLDVKGVVEGIGDVIEALKVLKEKINKLPD